MKFLTQLALTTVLCLSSLGMGGTVAYAGPTGAEAPIGFYVFCMKNPSQCRAGGQTSMAETPRTLSTLRRVNLSVNRMMQPKADAHGDVWTVGASVGDCEDYVLNKRAALIRNGLPPSALRVAYVRTASGEEHAVLVAMVGKSKLVLDNLTNEIKSLAQSGLTLVRISGATPTRWI